MKRSSTVESKKASLLLLYVLLLILAIETRWLHGVEGKITSRTTSQNITSFPADEPSPSRRGKPRRRRNQPETKASTPKPRRATTISNNKSVIEDIDTIATGCHDYVSLKSVSEKWSGFWHRRGSKPKLAYKMAVLAAMSYWEFHKWTLPLNATGFRLENDKRHLSIFYLARDLRTFMVDTLSQSNIQTATYRTDDYSASLLKNTTSQDLRKNTLVDDKSKSNQDNDYINFEYWMYNWYEPTGVAGVTFHDTDILISTSDNGNTLTVTFAGTQSASDAITNVQTFEPANHSSFFKDKQDRSLEGSLHRGFLNAYSRVSRGRVLRLGINVTGDFVDGAILESLHRRFAHCTVDAKRQSQKRRKQSEEAYTGAPDEGTEIIDRVEDSRGNSQLDATSSSGTVKAHRAGGCKSKGDKLVLILREVVLSALSRRRTVHIVGHSLGGGLATLSALDIIINFPEIPVSRLHLWTFGKFVAAYRGPFQSSEQRDPDFQCTVFYIMSKGAPEISDDIFLNSALQAAPRLAKFLRVNGNGRFHRYVTMSDKCQADVVSVVTGRALNARKKNLHGRAARRLGGVHGDVVHLAEPKFLLTPDQYMYPNNGTLGSDTRKRGSTTHSATAAHALLNYLHGISRESKDHPLRTDFPLQIVKWIGEIKAEKHQE